MSILTVLSRCLRCSAAVLCIPCCLSCQVSSAKEKKGPRAKAPKEISKIPVGFRVSMQHHQLSSPGAVVGPVDHTHRHICILEAELTLGLHRQARRAAVCRHTLLRPGNEQLWQQQQLNLCPAVGSLPANNNQDNCPRVKVLVVWVLMVCDVSLCAAGSVI